MTMRRLSIFFLFVSALLTSCITDEVDYVRGDNTQPSYSDSIHILGAVEDYDIKSVGTRATDVADSHISEMTMFIFDKNKNLVQGYSARAITGYDEDGNPNKFSYNDSDKCSSAINIQKANPTFLVDTKSGIIASLDGDHQTQIFYDHTLGTLDECTIYIVANLWHQLEGKLGSIEKLEDLLSQVIDIDATLDMPKIDENTYRGFPMIGTHIETVKFNLNKDGENKNTVATISLKKLYAKVNFTMQVNATEVVDKQVPEFEIEKVEVFNVPTKAILGRKLNSAGKPVYEDDNSDDYINEIAGGSITEANIADYYQFTGNKPFVISEFEGKTTIKHDPSKDTREIIEFGFYMPEHKVTPNEITYPQYMPEDLYQYFKPKCVGAVNNGDGTISTAKIATFVRIHGTYTDHNGQIKTVRYDIYLGQDNTDDFTIKRNQLLKNKLIITGLTNHKDAYYDGDDDGNINDTNISIDHRVEVDYKGFRLSMERTAILDAHFEVRPLDIEVSPGSTVTVQIPAEYKSWLAIEDDAASRTPVGKSSGYYVDTSTPRRGVRKYFTIGLIDELWANNGGELTFKHSNPNSGKTEIFRVWLYIDENVNVYDQTGQTWPNTDKDVNGDNYTYSVSKDMYRIGKINFYHAEGENTPITSLTADATVNMQQWNLWRVWNSAGTRYYDIEHEEEYLNNYASDQLYGPAQDGMEWGLEGIQLSNDVPAYWAERHRVEINIPLIGNFAEWLIDRIDEWFNISSSASQVFASSNQKPYYDFYLSRDNFPTGKLESTANKTLYARDYSGLQFNKEIAETLKGMSNNPKAKIDGVFLTEDPISAFAYCYNKNRRNANGSIDVDKIKWYLPAIDEIEDIALGAYLEFDKVFQNKEYWSCQPAYDYNTLRLNPGGKSYGIEYSSVVWFEGEFYSDNTKRARSTSVYATSATDYTTIESGLPAGVISGNLTATVNENSVSAPYSPITIDYNAAIYTSGDYRGNSARSEICRIRAVYRSGTR